MSARKPPQQRRFQFSNLGVTRGALVIAGLELGLSLIWLLANKEAKGDIALLLVASPSQIFEDFKLWTLVTSPLLEMQFLGLLLHVLMLFTFIPTLERFWGTGRFYRFVAITSIVGTIAGVAVGQLLGRNVPINGLSPMIWASVVAFGIIYARQPVQFWGVLPLTGRQLMYGFIGFGALFVGLQQLWELAAAFAAAMLTAALMVSKRWSPGLAWKRWRIARARAKLSVMQGGQTGKPAGKSGKRDEQQWLN